MTHSLKAAIELLHLERAFVSHAGDHTFPLHERVIAFLTEPRVIGAILKHLAAMGVDARSPPAAATDNNAA